MSQIYWQAPHNCHVTAGMHLTRLGLAIVWNPKFDLREVVAHIQQKGKFAWRAGGIVFADELLKNNQWKERHMYAVIKRKGMSSITIGARIDLGYEFRTKEYLGSPQTSEKHVKPEHEKYQQEGREKRKSKAFLFIDKIFWLKEPIDLSRLVKIMTKKPLDDTSFQTPTVIDLERSKVYDLIRNSEKHKLDLKELNKNPFIGLLGNLEDDLTDGFAYLLRASKDMKMEFVRFLARKTKANLKIPQNPREVIIKKQQAINQSSRSKNVPDITIKLQEAKYWFVIENKLDSEPKLKQLENYRKQLLRERQAGKIVSISRTDPSKSIKKSITHISWKEIYDLIDKAEIEKEMSTLRKDFLLFMKSLGAS